MNQYLLNKQIDLGNSIYGCSKIYLDINFWIRLRDQEKDSDKALFDVLVKLVEENKCILPISETIFWEMMKQGDVETLKKMARVMSLLSRAISIISEKERQQIDFINFIHSKTQKPVFDLKAAVWTKISINIIYGAVLKFEPKKADNRFIDFLENVSFEKIISLAESNSFKPFWFRDDIEFQNMAKEKYKHENRSFKQMYLSELRGYLEGFAGDMVRYMDDIYFLETGMHLKPVEMEKVHLANWSLFIYNLVRTNKITTELPSYTIFSEMYASVRWNKERKYSDGNDTLDFMHATVALPCYDYFLQKRNCVRSYGKEN